MTELGGHRGYWNEAPPGELDRQLAQQCLDLLADTLGPETRVALGERARTWTRLAEEYETRIARDTASELQLRGQQQQQVQPKGTEEDDK